MNTESSQPVDPALLPPSERPATVPNTRGFATLRPRILELLQVEHRVTMDRLTSFLQAPEASIRREIRTLRQKGHNISFAWNGKYTYAA